MGRWARVLVGLALTISSLWAAGQAEAANVLLFYSSRYTHLGANNGHPPQEQEADNVKAALGVLGHAVTPIAGPDDPVGNCGFAPPNNGFSAPGTRLATADAYQTALAAADVFLIPEHSRYCSLAYDIITQRPDIVGVWRPWVAQGGGLVIHVGYEGREKIPDLLQVLFGFNLTGLDGTGVTTTRTPAAAATLFAAAPATLPGNNQIGLITLASLPPGSTSIYDDGTNASVSILPYGAGKIILLGWDWSYADPPFAGQQNGGWFPSVLNGAVAEALARRLTIAVAGDGHGVVAGSPAGIDGTIECGDRCAAHFPRGTPVTLTASPAAGSVFSGWAGGGCSGTGPCTVAMSGDTPVTATFSRDGSVSLPTLTLELNGGAFVAGQTMTVTATLTPGSSPMAVDAYIVLQLPGGDLWSLTPGGAAPGIAPVARDFVPAPMTGTILRYTFSGAEPPGLYQWFTAVTGAGTTDVIGSVDHDTFSVSGAGPP
jgi:List-Bact-rpt repeat protein